MPEIGTNDETVEIRNDAICSQSHSCTTVVHLRTAHRPPERDNLRRTQSSCRVEWQSGQ